MKIAVMQPYFFPYIGYWQLINSVDKFVILDDVNYIKRGYINSNYILVNGQKYKFTLSVEKASQNKLINETKLFFPVSERQSFMKTISLAYKKSPFFDEVYQMLEKIVMSDERDLTTLIRTSLEIILEYLGLNKEILLSSAIKKDAGLRAERRIIEINKRLEADVYINAIGGQSLYSKEDFNLEGIELKFLKMRPITYKQLSNSFVENLSFIDVLMNNSIEEIVWMLEQYDLI